MITEHIRFNTWEAFDRAVRRVRNNYGNKLIYGEIYVPSHERFKTWNQLHRAVDVVNQFRPVEGQNRNDTCPSICGEVVVEITWGMIR